MPLYEYQCERCGVRYEVIQKFSDAPLETCRDCGGAVHRLVSAPAIQFKGSGWYVTDYAKKSSGGETTSPPAAAPSTPAASGSDTSAAKPAAPASTDKK